MNGHGLPRTLSAASNLLRRCQPSQCRSLAGASAPVKGKELTQVLLERRYNGQMFVPSENHAVTIKPVLSPKGTTELDNLVLSFVKPEEKEMIRNYMLDTFYRTGIVPKALKLVESMAHFPMVDQELDMMLGSDMCTVIREKSTGELAGAGFNCLWKTNPSYNAFEVDPLEFLNTAGKIAESTSSSGLEARVVFRDYQYQLLYHLYQSHAKRSKADYIFYGGFGYHEPKHRGSNMSFNYLRTTNKRMEKINGVFTFVGTFPNFLPMISTLMKDHFVLLGDVSYNDIEFEYEGERIFNSPGSFVFMGTDTEKVKAMCYEDSTYNL